MVVINFKLVCIVINHISHFLKILICLWREFTSFMKEVPVI